MPLLRRRLFLLRLLTMAVSYIATPRRFLMSQQAAGFKRVAKRKYIYFLDLFSKDPSLSIKLWPHEPKRKSRIAQKLLISRSTLRGYVLSPWLQSRSQLLVTISRSKETERERSERTCQQSGQWVYSSRSGTWQPRELLFLYARNEERGWRPPRSSPYNQRGKKRMWREDMRTPWETRERPLDGEGENDAKSQQ